MTLFNKHDKDGVMEIKEITKEGLHNLFETAGHPDNRGAYTPEGKFWCKDGDWYVGIDNSTGNAWTEEFKNKEMMLRWLEGYEIGRCPTCEYEDINFLEFEYYYCPSCGYNNWVAEYED